MTSYIEQHNLLYPSQYGFRKGHSTQHAILDIINDIQANMNQRLLSCGVFIDLKKAFDTVDHEILLKKLNHYGFRGITNDWFSSYLSNRTQTTQVGQHISDKAIITWTRNQRFLRAKHPIVDVVIMKNDQITPRASWEVLSSPPPPPWCSPRVRSWSIAFLAICQRYSQMFK